MDKGIAISVKNINKHFKIHEDKKQTLRQLFTSLFNQGKTKRFEALKNVSFEVPKGEFFGIVGRNGSGKSTLLKIISGIYAPDKGGEIKVEGKLVPFLELGVGFNMDLTGRENIYLNGVILGMTRKYIQSAFDTIVEFAELEEFIDEPVKNYSSGMLVRLAFSIAIQSDADVYILDEILAVGDISFQRKCLRVFNDLKKQGKTVIYVSHSMESVEQYCDRALIIENHEVLKIGKPSEVTAIYQRILSQDKNDDSQNKIAEKRWGNKDVEITSVMIGLDGKKEFSFNENDKITFEIKLEINKDIDAFALGIAFYKSDGTLMFGTNSQNFGIHTNLEKEDKQKIVKFSIDAKYFPSDDYHITFAAYEMKTSTPLDYLHQMHKIRINNSMKDIGVAFLPVNFEINSAK